ncbi:MAG: conjugal transfer protein TraO [Flavobacteriaceae bacterium]|nr:conjugal transfer protein TraO [Flavobacteriaceae bacterium]
MKHYIIITTLFFYSICNSQTNNTIEVNPKKNVILFFESPILTSVTIFEKSLFKFNVDKPNVGIVSGIKNKDFNLKVTTKDGLIYNFILKYTKKINKDTYFINKDQASNVSEMINKIEKDLSFNKKGLIVLENDTEKKTTPKVAVKEEIVIQNPISKIKEKEVRLKASFDITAGLTADGLGANLNYNSPLKTGYLKTGIYTSFSKIKKEDFEVPYTIFSANMGYFLPIIKSKKTMLSLGVGGLLGFETVNKGTRELDNGLQIDAENNFIYGVFISSEIEFKVNNSIGILAKATEYIHLNSDLGNATFYGGLGLRFYSGKNKTNKSAKK